MGDAQACCTQGASRMHAGAAALLLLHPAPAPPAGHVTFFWNGNRSGYFDEELETYVEVCTAGL